jgi:hypothetical protein
LILIKCERHAGQICDRQRTARRSTNSERLPEEANVEHRNRMECVRWRLFTHCDECGSRAHPIAVVRLGLVN